MERNNRTNKLTLVIKVSELYVLNIILDLNTKYFFITKNFTREELRTRNSLSNLLLKSVLNVVDVLKMSIIL